MKTLNLVQIGMLIVFIGIFILIIGTFLTAGTDSKTKIAVGGFIGPIPFGFGNDKTLLYIVIGLTAFILIFSTVLNYIR